MKTSYVRNVASCSLLKVKRCFGGTRHFHLHGLRVSRARSRQPAETFVSRFLLGLLIDPENGDDIFIRNVSSFFTVLHVVMSQKPELFIKTAVRSSDPVRKKMLRVFHGMFCIHQRF